MAEAVANKICIYCLKTSPVTVDHVVPRTWFPNGRPIRVSIRVDACNQCNNEKSRNDEWLRKWMVSAVGERSPNAWKLFNEQVASSIKKRPAKGYEMLEQISEVDVIDKETGLWVGRRPVLHIPERHANRIEESIAQLIRGLYAWDRKEPLPDGFQVKTFFACDKDLQPDIKIFQTIARNLPFPASWHLADQDIFAFGRAYAADDDTSSIWASVFYETLTFISFIGRKEWFSDRNRILGQTDTVIAP